MQRGQLKFKTNFQKKLDDQRRSLKKEIIQRQGLAQDEELLQQEGILQETTTIEIPIQKGEGRILTSGKTCHGQDTKFQEQIQQGDKIIFFNSNSLAKEEQVVSAVLSNRSLQLYEAFTQDIISYTQYEIQKKPIVSIKEETLEQKFGEKLKLLKKPIKKETSVLEYRTPKGMWGYTKHKETINGKLTNEQLLDMRSKKKTDRFCWF